MAKPSLIFQDNVRDTTELRPGGSFEVTIRFSGRDGRLATIGNCRLTLEFVTGSNPNTNYHTKPELYSWSTKVDAN